MIKLISRGQFCFEKDEMLLFIGFQLIVSFVFTASFGRPPENLEKLDPCGAAFKKRTQKSKGYWRTIHLNSNFGPFCMASQYNPYLNAMNCIKFAASPILWLRAVQLRWWGPGWWWGGLHATLGSGSSPSSLINFHLQSKICSSSSYALQNIMQPNFLCILVDVILQILLC